MFPQVELGKAEVFQQGDALHPFRNFIWIALNETFTRSLAGMR
jgi:hypothetical protein